MDCERHLILMHGADDRVEFVLIEPVLGGQRGFRGGVVAGAVEDEEPMLTRKGGSGKLNVGFQEAELLWVMYLGRVVG